LGLLIIGCSAARQVGKSADGQPTFFQAEQTRGAFWRCLSILQAGGITIDKALADRILSGLTVRNNTIKDNSVGDLTLPFKLGELARIDGYIPYLTDAIRSIQKTELTHDLLAVILIEVILCLDSKRHKRVYPKYSHDYNATRGTANSVALNLSLAGMLAEVSLHRLRPDKGIRNVLLDSEHIYHSKYLFSDISFILRRNMKEIGLKRTPSIIRYLDLLSFHFRESSGDLDFEELMLARLADPTQNHMNEDD
jgi:hypothetical protein